MAAALTAAALLPAPAFGAMPARAPAAIGGTCVRPGQPLPTVPWAQQLLGPQRAWPLASGRNITVAVLDSGIDSKTQPQLRGRVTASIDFIDPTTKGLVDCSGHGTEVAGIINAQAAPDTQFRGLAPDVHLVSARVSDAEDGTGPSAGTPGLAHAIDWALLQKADVINISLTTTTDDPLVRDAVARAVAAGAVVVAAAGNNGAAGDGNPVLYPAAYPGVVGVGAIDAGGHRWDGSEHRPYVHLVAPGADIVSTQAGGGLVAGLNGTSYAAAFVSATAALVRSRYPTLSGPDVVRLLYATATPAPGGIDSDEYGNGIVNPYSAVVDRTGGGRPARLPGLHPSPANPAAQAHAAAWQRSTSLAAALTGAGILVALLVLGTARALPMARRRRWRVGMAPPVHDDPEDDEVQPPVQLFEDA